MCYNSLDCFGGYTMAEQIFHDHESDIEFMEGDSFLRKVESYEMNYSYTAKWIKKLSICILFVILTDFVLMALFTVVGLHILFSIETIFPTYFIIYISTFVIILILKLINYKYELRVKIKLGEVNIALEDIYELEILRLESSLIGSFYDTIGENVVATFTNIKALDKSIKIHQLLVIGINTELYRKGYKDVENKGKFVANIPIYNIGISILLPVGLLVALLLTFSASTIIGLAATAFTFAVVALFGIIPYLIELEYLTSSVKMLKVGC